MAAICRYLLDFYIDLLEKKADPRVEQLPLMSTPFPVIGLIIFYIYFVTKLGPHFMKSREAFNLKYFMIFYNVIQIVLNSYIFVLSIKIPFFQLRYSLICEEVDYSDEPTAVYVAQNVWLFFIIKILDLLDTVVMVLRKKQNQVSFLHVYHHWGMVTVTWIATKYVAGGHVVLIGFINSLVHTIMYSYYLLTVMYPEYKKSIWWKKHLTQLQMVQFVILIWHSTIAVVNPYCNFPKPLMALFMPQNIFMFVMFWDFYKKNYISKKGNEQNKFPNNELNINNNIEKKKII